MGSTVHIARTGTANLASVAAALARAGMEVELTTDPEAVRRAERVVLPGVGAFDAAMTELSRTGLAEALIERIGARRPTLAICLGMQLFAATSAESPGARGLGLVSAPIERLSGARVPHFGWSEVRPGDEAELLRPGYAYFAHSYRLLEAPAGFRAAYTTHGETFVSAFETGPILACQFHPELSGSYGRQLIQRWIDAGRR
ncbi:MAG: imidazole glycerol phosphate synthase subunit HisH [Myxococcota bacterium]